MSRKPKSRKTARELPSKNKPQLAFARARLFRNTADVPVYFLRIALVIVVHFIERIPSAFIKFLRALPGFIRKLPKCAARCALGVSLLFKKVSQASVHFFKKFINASPRALAPSLIAVLLSVATWACFAFFGPLNPYQNLIAYNTGVGTFRLSGISFIFLAVHIFLEIYLWLGLRVAYFRAYLLQYRSLRILTLIITALMWVGFMAWLTFFLSSLITPPVVTARNIFGVTFLFILGLRHFVMTPLLLGKLSVKTEGDKNSKRVTRAKRPIS